MSGIIAGATLGAGALGYLGAKKAGDAASTAASDSAAVQKQMFDLSRADMAPYTAAGADALNWYKTGLANQPGAAPIFDPYQIQGITPEFAEGGSRFTGTRLDSPTFRGTRVPVLQEFQGSRFDYDPSFEGSRFSYDPNEAMNSPDIQFLQQQGEQALMRNLAGNRQLGSGSRMMDIMKFNQGLSSQGLQDYYNRQRQMNEMNYGRDIGENQMAYGRALEMNRENYGRDLTENELNTLRRLQAEQANYGRDVGEFGLNLDIARQADTTNYARALGEDELAYSRGLTERDIQLSDWEREQQRQLANAQAIQQAALDRSALNQGLYQDRMSNLAGLINVGSGAGAITSQGALNTGQALSNIYENLGQSQAQSAQNRFSMLGSTLGGLGNLYMLNQGGYFGAPNTLQTTLQNQPTVGSGFYTTNPYGP
jgi:hypothetical protein